MKKIAFFSDLHNSKYHLDCIMNNIFELTDNGESLDGLVLVGDIVYHNEKTLPSAASYDRLNANEKYTSLRDSGKLVFCMGNHEFKLFSTDEDETKIAKDSFTAATGLTPEKDTVLGGYHFITAGPYDYNGSLSAEQEKVTREALEAALSDGTQKPVFLIVHQPIDDTLFGTDGTNAYSKEFKAFISAQPRLIVVSGHTHYPVSDPRSICQIAGGATFLYTSSVMGGNGLKIPAVQQRHAEYPSQGLIAEIDEEKNTVSFRGFYVVDGTPEYIDIEPRVLDIPAMTADSKESEHDLVNVYKYTYERKSLTREPYFAEDAVASVCRVSDTWASVTFPAALQAEGEDSVIVAYDMLLCDGNGELIRVERIISDYFLPPCKRRNNYTVNFFELQCDSDYSVMISPITAWYLVGKSYVKAAFKTEKQLFPTITPDAERIYTRGVPDTEFIGKYTSYSTLVQIAASWVTEMVYKVKIEKEGSYRLTVKGASAQAAELSFEAETDKDTVRGEAVINTGSLFTYKDVNCADIDFASPGEYTVRFKKDVTVNTIGIVGITLTGIKEE